MDWLLWGEGVEQLSHPLTTAVRCEMREYERHNLPFQFYLCLYISLPAFCASARFSPLSAFLKHPIFERAKKKVLSLSSLRLLSSLPQLSVCI